MKHLIITADDFGYSELFNKGILELLDRNHLTSTSVMVDRVDNSQKIQVQRLIELSKSHNISTGLHVEFKNTNFKSEVQKQFKRYMDLFGRKPDYIDIHKTIFLKEGYPVIQKFCLKEKLPCRNLSIYDSDIMINGVITTKNTIFSGTKKTIEQIEVWISNLQDDYHEIVFHPGYYDPNSKSSFNIEREEDMKNIEKLASLLAKYDIQSANFNDLVSS